MTTETSPKPSHMPLSGRPETPDERTARSRHEAALIAQGEADFAAGRYYNHDEVEAWLKKLEIDPNTPIPPLTPKSPR